MAKEIYLSVDIEADGRIPGANSMLSFGISAITINKEIVSSFTRNLELFPGATQDADTMDFWAANPVAWEACRQNPEDPGTAMIACYQWIQEIKKLGYKPILVGFPGGYDFMWFHWYMNKYTSHNPCGWAVLCIKTMAMAHLGIDFQKSAKRNYPRHWFQEGLPHTHVAIDDATEQGALAMNILREIRKLPAIKEIAFTALV